MEEHIKQEFIQEPADAGLLDFLRGMLGHDTIARFGPDAVPVNIRNALLVHAGELEAVIAKSDMDTPPEETPHAAVFIWGFLAGHGWATQQKQ